MNTLRIPDAKAFRKVMATVLADTGLSQRGYAAKIGVSPKQVENWLAGRAMPAGQSLLLIAAGGEYELALIPKRSANEDGPRDCAGAPETAWHGSVVARDAPEASEASQGVEGCPAHRARYAAQQASVDPIPRGAPGCARCTLLRKEARFWRDQQKFAASVAADLADLNDHDQQVAKLRALLAESEARREQAQRQVDVLTYRLDQATGADA